MNYSLKILTFFFENRVRQIQKPFWIAAVIAASLQLRQNY